MNPEVIKILLVEDNPGDVRLTREAFREGKLGASLAWLLLFVGAVIGLWLIHTGTPRSHWNSLYAHVVLSVAGVGIAFACWWSGRAGSSTFRLVRFSCAALMLR